MSRHERYSLVRRHIGSPSVLTYVISFDKDAAYVPSEVFLKQRMHHLAKDYPILSCRVDKAWTSKPVLEHITLSDAVISERVTAKTVHDEDGNSNSVLENIFQECIQWASKFEPETGDLWRVGRYLDNDSGKVYLTFSVDHILGDGRGALHLLPLIVKPELKTAESALAIPPALEDHINIKPTIATILNAVLQSLIIPKLPSWMVPAFLAPKPFWPYDSAPQTSSSPSKERLPLEAPVGVLVGKWTGPQVKRLYDIFAKHGDGTSMQGIISACCMGALWMVESQDAIATEATSRSVQIKLTTPTSERNTTLGHPHILGNYVGTVDTEAAVNGDSDLVQLARQYSEELKKAKASKSPPKAWGLLDYIDDPVITEESGSELTGWEKFFLEKAASKSPFGSSIEISNLGLMPALDANSQAAMTSVDWMQTPTAIGAAMTVNVLGAQPAEVQSRFGELHFTIAWRVDSAPGGRLSAHQVGEYKRLLQELPNALSELARGATSLSLTAARDILFAQK